MEKRLKWTDEGLNCYGFWILTEGIQMEDFDLNPIMLWNHHRSWEGKINEILPLGKWIDYRKDGKGEMSGQPVFDLKDEFALKISNKVEGGFLSACSIGIRILETSDDPKYLKPGQTRATVTKCVLKEVSVCDIPANPRAAGIVLYDENDQVIELSADGSNCPVRLINNQNNNSMKEIAKSLGLSDQATEAEMVSAVASLKSEHKTEVETLTTAKEKAENELKEFKEKQAAANKAEALSLTKEAVQAGKITADAEQTWLSSFERDFDGTKAMLSGLSPRTKFGDMVGKPGGSSSKFANLSYHEIDQRGWLAELKETDPQLFEQKVAEMAQNYNITTKK